MTRKSKFKIGLVLFVVTLLCAAVAGEFGLRWYERRRAQVPVPMLGLYYQHSRLRYALIRNHDYYGWAHVNAQGFRGREDVPLKKPEGVLRVMAVGGSTTFETTVSGDDKAWPARLAAHLRELAPERRVEVINAGVPGYRNLDNLIRLETELHAYQPDIIILYEVHNDLYESLRALSEPPEASDTPDEMPTVTPWVNWLRRHSLLYMKSATAFTMVRRKLRSKGKKEDPEQTKAKVAEALERGAQDFERSLTSFVAVANSHGIHVVLPEVTNISGSGASGETDTAIQQVWKVNFPYTTPEVVLRGYQQFNDAVRRAAACNASATYIPTADFGMRGTEWYAPWDPIHTNDRGADRMGRKMAEALLAAGVLDRALTVAAPCGR